MAIYSVPLNAVNCKILLYSVRVHHVENAQTWLTTVLFTPLQRITFKTITFTNVTCTCYSHSRLQWYR